MTLADGIAIDGSLTIRQDVSRLPAGMYFVRATGLDKSAGVQVIQTVQAVLGR